VEFCPNEASLNRVAYMLTIVFCAAMMLSLPSSAISQSGHPKDVREAALDNERGLGDGQQQWEHDPIVFSPRDRKAIRNYYRGADSKLAPRLAKQNGLVSPALRKPLQRNGIIPAGLQRLVEPLASDLERGLQPLDSNYSRGIVGQDVVIIENRTQRIVDVIRGVANRR
jgi:hypothetical protein